MKKTFNVLSVRLFGLAVVIAAIALNAMLITGCNDEPDDSSTHADGKYDAIYLKANSWNNENGGSGENWSSDTQIKLSDFTAVKPEQGKVLRFKISGVSDKEIKYFRMDIYQLSGDGLSTYRWLGLSDKVVLPKTFNNSIFDISIWGDYDSNAVIYIDLLSILWQKNSSGEYTDNSGETLPADTPNGTVMATIKNFSISLVSIVKGDDGGGNEPPVESGEFEEYALTLPSGTSAAETVTGERSSILYKFTVDDFTKIKNANPGSFLEVTYRTMVTYRCGEIGWIDRTDAGPVIIGNSSSMKNHTVKYNVEDLVLGTDNFTIHMFNNGTLRDVVLYIAPNGYVPAPNPKATAGATKIVIPQGRFGNGDLSKADFKKITTAASGTLVFYFDDDANTDSGILKFGPKSGDPYKHYGIDEDGTIGDYSGKGWRVVNAATKTITYNVSDIKKAVADAAADFPAGTFEWLEINMGIDNNADLLYIELIP